MIYLASPYSHPRPEVMAERFRLAMQCTANLLKQGNSVYSPIAHCHELAITHNLPTDFAFWRKYDFDMLRRADTFMILKIDGYVESVGLTAEWELARTLSLPIYYVDEKGEVLL